MAGLKVLVADLTTTTVAALMPSDWRIALCDERLELVDFDCDADVIGITGKMSQRDRMIELAALYRARGKLVVIGGPYATLNPDDIAPHCDILVKGEIEEIAAQIFADIAAGCWRQEYTGSKVDLSLSPTPRWISIRTHQLSAALFKLLAAVSSNVNFVMLFSMSGASSATNQPARSSRNWNGSILSVTAQSFWQTIILPFTASVQKNC